METNNNLELLPVGQIKSIQLMIGSFLYYARALNSTMLLALNKISSLQAKPTQCTKEEC